MTDYEDRHAKWKAGWLRAAIHYCGDDCCCSQPQIDLFEPRRNYPCVKSTSLWEGTYLIEASAEEHKVILQELIEASARFDIPLDGNEDNPRGTRLVNPGESFS